LNKFIAEFLYELWQYTVLGTGFFHWKLCSFGTQENTSGTHMW